MPGNHSDRKDYRAYSGLGRVMRALAATLSHLVPAAGANGQVGPPVQVVHPGGSDGDWFGTSVAVDADTMVIGSPGDDFGPNGDLNLGSVHVFRRIGSAWTLEATITAENASHGDAFGKSVAISGDTLVIGASGKDVGGRVDQGAAYVFTRSGTLWAQQAQLTAADGASGDTFGTSVAVENDTILVGAPSADVGSTINQGAAYVFVRSGTTWVQQGRLLATNGGTASELGNAVAISGDTVLIGAAYDANDGNRGKAYVFVRDGQAWTQQTRLTALDAAPNDSFGRAVALSGSTAVIGAPGNDLNGNVNQGSAYVFIRSGTTWIQQAQLLAPDGMFLDSFGYGVAIKDDVAIIGASDDRVFGSVIQGSAHVFSRASAVWAHQSQLIAPDGAQGDNLGVTIAFDGTAAVCGVWADDVGDSADQGSAWVFQLAVRCGNSDFNGDGDSGTDQDIEAFFACLGGNCCATCYSGGADFNGDGDAGTDQDIESFFRVLTGGSC